MLTPIQSPSRAVLLLAVLATNHPLVLVSLALAPCLAVAPM